MAKTIIDRAIGFIAGGLLVAWLMSHRDSINQFLVAGTPVIEKWDSIYTPAVKFDYKGKLLRFTDVVASQIALETYYCQSKVYNENNNIVGMKHNSRGLSKGTKNNHACYPSRVASLMDYAMLQQKYLPKYEAKFGPVTTDKEYIKFLRYHGYAEDQYYQIKLEDMLETVKKVKQFKNLKN